jgi:hypothetical protein
LYEIFFKKSIKRKKKSTFIGRQNIDWIKEKCRGSNNKFIEKKMGKGESKGERKDLKNSNRKMWNNRENNSQKRRGMVGTRREKKIMKSNGKRWLT